MPWQQHNLDVALELDPDTGGLWYEESDIAVPRQSGKTTLVVAKNVHRLVVMARQLGPQRSTYTAQKRDAARRKLERDFAPMLRRSRGFDEIAGRRRTLKPTDWKLSLNNGSECIEFGTGSYWQIDTPSRTGGHGDTLDTGDIDEAFSQEDDEVEGGMRPTMATRLSRQIWVLSTAGDERSRYWYRKILAGRDATETDGHGRICYMEWSAPDDADPGDPRVWRMCSPALGHTIDESFLASEWAAAQRKGPDGIATFRRAYLNQWPNPPVLEDLAAETVIPVAVWSAARDERSQIEGRVSLALDMNPERTWCAIAAAGRRTDGRLHVEVIQHEPGTGWPVPRLREIAGRQAVVTLDGRAVVVIDPRSPAYSLKADLERDGLKVVEPSAREVAGACGALVDDITDARTVHLGQPALDAAMVGAAKTATGDGQFAWTRKHSSVDISPLVAVTLARWHSSAQTAPHEEESNLW